MYYDNISSFELKNDKTGETLIGHHDKNVFAPDHHLHVHDTFWITRQQCGAESTMRDWLEQSMTRDDFYTFDGCDQTQKQVILVEDPSIGYIDLKFNS